MKRLPIYLLACFLSLGLLAPVAAQETEPEPSTPDDATAAESPEATRARAREARIAEYLRKKEERRASRERSRRARQDEEVVEEPGPDTTPPPQKRKNKNSAQLNTELPRPLAQAQANVRMSKLGQDPTVRSYLDMVDRQAASAQQLGALGNFLAEGGMPWDALEYYLVAVNLDETDSVLWLNLGTVHRKLGKMSSAIKAYETALEIAPNNAVAHYNLGAAYDKQNRYEGAIAEYKAALTIDPSLGDPAVNPQAANNPRLIAVRLLLYQEQVGSLGLPMVDVPGGELASEGAEGNDENGHAADK